MAALFMAIALWLLTISLVIWQPRGLAIGWSALLGALLSLLAGIIAWGDIWLAIQTFTNPFLVLLAALVISLLLDEAGFFQLLGRSLALLGLGIGWWLFCLVALFTAVATALFTNYGSILFWTPVVMETMLVLGFRPKPTLAYVLAAGFLADAASLPLPHGNLVNLLSFDFWELSLIRYALVLVPLHFVVLAASMGALWFYFERFIPPTYQLAQTTPAAQVIRDPLLCRWGFILLGGLLACYLIPSFAWLIAWLDALFTFFLAARLFNPKTRIIALGNIWSQIPGQVFLFAAGMYFVTLGLGKAGLLPLLAGIMVEVADWGLTLATTATGYLAAFTANWGHNLPAMSLNMLALQEGEITKPGIQEAMIYAQIIGCSLGAKVLPFASISTLLWLTTLRRKGLIINWSSYTRIHLALTLPVLFICLLSLSLWLPWLIV